MNTLLALFCIAVIMVFLVDISGAVESFLGLLKWVLTKGKMSDGKYILKPFSCSLCMTWWCGLAYLLVTTQLTLPYLTALCIICALTGVIKNLIILIEDLMTTLINLVYSKIIDR